MKKDEKVILIKVSILSEVREDKVDEAVERIMNVIGGLKCSSARIDRLKADLRGTTYEIYISAEECMKDLRFPEKFK